MKKLFLIMACMLVAACDVSISTFMQEYHLAAAVACEKNDGYEKLRVWTDHSKIGSNEHLVIICNDKAEMYITRRATGVDGEWVWGEWESDNQRFGGWQ